MVGIDEVEICVDAWIIQDGNYADFHIGDELRCAFEFFGAVTPAAQCSPSIKHLRQNDYWVCAKVVFADTECWAVDFGYAAYQEYRPPDSADIGTWVEGEIGLALDPFMYKDRLASKIGMPDLFKKWIVTGIARDDTPWIASPCGKILSRAVERPCWTEVPQTDAWNDDGGRSAYLLRLSLSALI